MSFAEKPGDGFFAHDSDQAENAQVSEKRGRTSLSLVKGFGVFENVFG